jgi:DNA primase large subunit
MYESLTNIDIVLAEIEACSYRNKSPAETASHITPLLQKFLPLSSNTSSATGAADQRLKNERQKDHYSHFILRLAFSATEDLRRRFARAETMLFRFRFQNDDSRERRAFVESLSLDWEPVSDEERHEVTESLASSTPGLRRVDEETWYKVDWEKVPELIERRNVFLKKGKAYVPGREQLSMIMAEFTARLERSLEVGLHRITYPFPNASEGTS